MITSIPNITMSNICLLCGENETPEGSVFHNICDRCFDNAGDYIETNVHCLLAFPYLLESLKDAADALDDFYEADPTAAGQHFGMALRQRMNTAIEKAKDKNAPAPKSEG